MHPKQIYDSRQAVGVILKNRKLAMPCISKTAWLILTKFDMVMYIDPLESGPHPSEILQFLKSKMAAATTLKLEKLRYIKNWWTDFNN